jgi:hypothetical protein
MSEPRRTAPPDLEGEQEIDLRSAWRRIAERWWLPVGGLVVGAILGVLVSVGGGDVFEARTLVYLGQPFTPGGGGQIQSLQTNPRTVSEIIRSDSARRKAAQDSGLRVGQLRGNVTSQSIVAPGQAARAQSPLVEIIVQAPQAAKAQRAADSLAGTVIDQASTYVDSKINLLEAQIESDERQLADIATRINQALAQQRTALAPNSTLTLAEKLLVSTNSNATINSAEQRRGTVQQDLNIARQLLSLAQQVERTRVIQPALAVRTAATSRRNAAAVGALLGLVVGMVAAWLVDPIAARRKEPAGG